MLLFSTFIGQCFIVKGQRFFRVQANVELIFPPEFKARFANSIITVLCSGVPFCQICCVSCKLIGNHTFFYVIAVG